MSGAEVRECGRAIGGAGGSKGVTLGRTAWVVRSEYAERRRGMEWSRKERKGREGR